MVNEIDKLLGKTLTRVEKINTFDKDEIHFYCSNGTAYKMHHCQDCCESVYIEDICGDLEDLIGEPILMAEEVTNRGETGWGTCTWTFYKLATVKGYVTIRWYGESNGYYSESIDFSLLD